MKSVVAFGLLLVLTDERVAAPDLQNPQRRTDLLEASSTDSSMVEEPSGSRKFRIAVEVSNGQHSSSERPEPHTAALEVPIRVAAASENQPEWWLGVSCVEAPGVLLQHLELTSGLLVGCVAPDSPAAAADLRADDILLAFDDQPILNVDDLVEFVESSAGRDVRLQVLRRGERQEISLAAARRPRATPIVVMVDSSGRPIDAESARLLERVRTSAPLDGISLLLIRPGIVVSREQLPNRTFDVYESRSVTLGPTELSPELAAGTLQQLAVPGTHQQQLLRMESVVVGDERILLYSGEADPTSIRWAGSPFAEADAVGRFGKLPRIETVTISASEGMPAGAPRPIDTTAELFRLRQRTEQLEQELRMMRTQMESLQRRLDHDER